MTCGPNIAVIVGQEQARIRAEQQGSAGRAAVTAGAEFSVLSDDRYRLALPAIGSPVMATARI